MSAKRKKQSSNHRSPVKQQPEPTAPRPWAVSTVAKAFVVGFLVSAALVRMAPIDPSVAFLIGGLGVGLACTTVFEALTISLVVQLSTIGVLLVPVGGQTPTLPPTLFALSLLAATVGAVIAWFAAQHVNRKWLAWALLAIVLVIFTVQALAVAKPIAQQITTEPPNEGFQFDPVFFVKLFYLQENGRPFYPAFGEAFVADGRFDKPTPDLAGWRSPTVSTIWTFLFGNASQIVYAFVALAFAAIVAVYYLASRESDDVTALAGATALVPYYTFAIQRFWFTEYELWASFVVVGVAVLYVLKRFWPAAALALLAGAMREWLISATMSGAIDHLLHRRWKKAIPWMIGFVGVVAVYLANMVFVRRYLESVGVPSNLGAAGRLGGGGPGFILYTVKFCADFLANPYIVSYAIFFLGLAGAVYLIFRKEYFLPLLLILPLCAFLIFGSGKGPGAETGWNDYYNAAYWPFAAMLAPVALRFFTKRPTPRA